MRLECFVTEITEISRQASRGGCQHGGQLLERLAECGVDELVLERHQDVGAPAVIELDLHRLAEPEARAGHLRLRKGRTAGTVQRAPGPPGHCPLHLVGGAARAGREHRGQVAI